MAEFTTDDLTEINSAIKRGVRKCKIEGKEVEYASLDEMLRIRDLIRKDLGLTNSTTRLYANFSKGLD